MAAASIVSKARPSAEEMLGAIGSGAQILAEDAEDLRHAIHRQGGVDRALAWQIVQADRRCGSCEPAWAEFYMEALSEHFLTGVDGLIVLRPEDWSVLLDWIGANPAEATPCQRRLLLRLRLRAQRSPVTFQAYVLALARHSFLHDERSLLGDRPRQTRTIDAIDLQLVRRLVLGAGGQDPAPVDRASAAFLFELHRATTCAGRAEGWQALFVEALLRHLLALPGEPAGKSVRVAQAEADWLASELAQGTRDGAAVALLTRLEAAAPDLPHNLEKLRADLHR